MSRTWKQSMLTLPGVGVALIPKLFCPACLPAYAGLLSSIGLGVLVTTYLLPITVGFLAITLFALAYRAGRRHGYRPFMLGVLGSVGVLAGKFLWSSKLIMYGGVAVLVGASIWNALPRRQVQTCSRCAVGTSGVNNNL